MDGFESNEGVILVAATNRPDVLDPALLRPGRFDRQVVIPAPDIKGREGILKVHTKKIPLAEDVDLQVLARGTPGFTGADLANLVNEAALYAARFDKKAVEMNDFEMAKDKVLMGAERRSMIISDEEKRVTAYHESGHTLVARLLPGTDPVHKVTIIPRGRALGLTQQLPIDERHTYHREYLNNSIAILLGGRAAEELVLNQLTTGAGNDLERATDLARKMVCEWGMSEKLGPLTFGKREEQIFLGREFAQHKDYSESTAVEIDGEVKHLVMGELREGESLTGETQQHAPRHGRGPPGEGSAGWKGNRRHHRTAQTGSTGSGFSGRSVRTFLVREMEEIGVDPEGIALMSPKGIHRALRLEDLSPWQANLLKQEMLSLGGEAAVHRGALDCSASTTGALLMGTVKHFRRLLEKLSRQPPTMRRIGEELRAALDNFERRTFTLTFGGRVIELGEKTAVMGIVNVSPDSFYDGGKHFSVAGAVEHGLKLAGEGADLLDVGGESTRPGAEPLSAEEEQRRVLPVIEVLASRCDLPVSVDTYKAEVARRALEAGALMVNDVSGLRFDPEMAGVVAAAGAGLVVMHMRGEPRTMQKDPSYDNLMAEIIESAAPFPPDRRGRGTEPGAGDRRPGHRFRQDPGSQPPPGPSSLGAADPRAADSRRPFAEILPWSGRWPSPRGEARGYAGGGQPGRFDGRPRRPGT